MIKKTLHSILTIFIISFSFTSCSQIEKSNSNQNEPTIEKTTIDLFIGTYTKKEGHVDGKAKGIYLYDLDAKTGALTNQRTTEEVINPSFISLSSDANFLYAVKEIGPVALEATFRPTLTKKDGPSYPNRPLKSS